MLVTLLKDNNLDVIIKDILGGYHFNGSFKNSNDLKAALKKLNPTRYQTLVEKDTNFVLQIFEDVFNHIAFTGRSGTFYAYEGLGSIYWHMVSKLHLAVQEACLKSLKNQDDSIVSSRLMAHYEAIGQGIGLHKSPKLYGAFPTDAYSHTPGHRGAQQPGMTGQVKEDVLIRFSELGVLVDNGRIHFEPTILRESEFLTIAKDFYYFDVNGDKKNVHLSPGTLFFTCCQIPVIYNIADNSQINVSYNDGSTKTFDTAILDGLTSQKIFGRTGEVIQINANISKYRLIN